MVAATELNGETRDRKNAPVPTIRMTNSLRLRASGQGNQARKLDASGPPTRSVEATDRRGPTLVSKTRRVIVTNSGPSSKWNPRIDKKTPVDAQVDLTAGGLRVSFPLTHLIRSRYSGLTGRMYRSAMCELAEWPSQRFTSPMEVPGREPNSVAPRCLSV